MTFGVNRETFIENAPDCIFVMLNTFKSVHLALKLGCSFRFDILREITYVGPRLLFIKKFSYV